MASSIAFIGGQNVYCSPTERAVHITTGRVLEQLALRYDTVYLATSITGTKKEHHDYPVPENVEIVEIPHYSSSRDALGKLSGIRDGYRKAVCLADHVFIRAINPGADAAFDECYKQGKSPLLWAVGNPIALLRSHRRDGFVKDSLGIVYSYLQERKAIKGINKSGGACICNGEELYERFAACRRYVTVSSTTLEEDMFYREDTCKEDPIRICSVAFIRPEKGIQHLLESLALMKNKQRVELYCVGDRSRYPSYQARLDRIAQECEMEGRVHFPGHATRDQVNEQLIKSDIFVLPTLSEGTPHVLAEARSCGVPVVASRVGGVPTCIDHERDGLLVPSEDPRAIAEAVDRIIDDGHLRRTLIKNGYEKVKAFAVDRFADRVCEILHEIN